MASSSTCACAATLPALDSERGTFTVREGKGRKDRVVPMGERALHWVDRYIEEVRPLLVVPPDRGIVFLSDAGNALKLERLTALIARYVDAAKTGKSGGTTSSATRWPPACSKVASTSASSMRSAATRR